MADFVVDRGYATRATAAVFRHPRGGTIGFWVYLFALLVLSVVLVFVSPDAVLPGIATVVVIVLPIVAFARARRILNLQLPVGSLVQVDFGEESFTVIRKGSEATVEYTQYREALRSRDIVLVRQLSGMWQVLPGALVTDADLARFPRKGDPS